MPAGRGGSKRASRHERKSGPRPDKMGDITMGSTPSATRPRGGGGIGKSSNKSSGAARKKDLLNPNNRRAILQHAAGSDVAMKGAERQSKGLIQLKVTGWTGSKASTTSADRGASALVSWLEKKASNRMGVKGNSVKIKKSNVDGDTLIISVPAQDVSSYLRMDGYGWAGTSVAIKRLDQTGREKSPEASETMKIRAMLRGVMERRYDFDAKFLDLSALRQDEELNAQKVFDMSSTTSKFFPAMMAVLEKSFDTDAEKNAAITSVSLANNELDDLNVVTSLAQTLPKLLNLDLSNNKIAKLSALELWRKRFYHLQHLILTGNPIEQAEPTYAQEVVHWYRNLRILNGVQVRTEDEVAARKAKTELPFPIRSPRFADENGIAENFIRTFLTGYDTDRAALAAYYYDEQSEFSFAVNTAAPRDPSGGQTEKQEWENYIKGSRNLKKISQIQARQNRMFRGTKPVADAFAALPKSRHPDLASEARKYMIEAHVQPGLSDPTGASPHGVDGFFVSMHGEFQEIDEVGQPGKTRSFDRTFILGAGGPAGVRVVCDLLTIRAFGGSQAFDPTNFEDQYINNLPAQPVQVVDAAPQLPPGVTIEIAEQMVIEMQKQTGMTVAYAKDCLEQVAWDFEKGLVAFASVRANLPPTAFVQMK